MRKNQMILHNLKRTCEASPSQWEAINEQGENVYIRFRFDSLQVHCPFNSDDAKQDYDAFMAVQILKREHIYRDPYKGYIEDEEMLRLTGYTVAEEKITR
jgi:hypothetical protein